MQYICYQKGNNCNEKISPNKNHSFDETLWEQLDICISSLLMFTVIMFLSLITCRNGELDDIYQIRSGYKLLQIRETDTTHPLSGKQLYASIRETLNEDTDILIFVDDIGL